MADQSSSGPSPQAAQPSQTVPAVPTQAADPTTLPEQLTEELVQRMQARLVKHMQDMNIQWQEPIPGHAQFGPLIDPNAFLDSDLALVVKAYNGQLQVVSLALNIQTVRLLRQLVPVPKPPETKG